jgi:hypothetical protein
LKWIIGIIFLGGFLYYFGFWAVYYFSMKKSNKEAMEISCVEQTNQSYDGKIDKVLRYEYSGYMNQNFFGLDILTEDSTENRISYQFLIKSNSDLLKFAEVGQAIKKEKGKDYFELTLKNGISKTFKVPDCEK